MQKQPFMSMGTVVREKTEEEMSLENTHKKDLVPPTWTEAFEREFEKRWKEGWNTQPKIYPIGHAPTEEIHVADHIKEYIHQQFSQLKQQHMTNQRIVPLLAEVLQESVIPSVKESYEETVVNRILPALRRRGVDFCEIKQQESGERISGVPRPAQGYDNRESVPTTQLAPGQSTGEAFAKTGQVYSSSETVIKPFLMINLDCIKKQYAEDEIIRIFESTGMNIIRKRKNLDWGEALKYLKEGNKVARTGWNGQGMFVYYVPKATYPSVTEVAKKEFGTHTCYESYFALRNVRGTVNTWVPSVADNLAEDWYVVE